MSLYWKGFPAPPFSLLSASQSVEGAFGSLRPQVLPSTGLVASRKSWKLSVTSVSCEIFDHLNDGIFVERKLSRTASTA